ncbi:MAG: glycosyltransferase family 2 protein [Paracoccaceae bacterium]
MLNKIAVSIINFRTPELTQKCVLSVLQDMEGIDGKIVIIDNHSGDGSAEIIQAWIETLETERIELIRSTINSGFSGGHNQVIAAYEAEFYLILNSDALLQPGFLKSVIATAEADPKAGLITPILSYQDGIIQTSCFRFHSPGSEIIRSAKTGFVTRLFSKYHIDLGTGPVTKEIDWASFACILVRADMCKAIGPMDEGYFLYFEDAEYCLRAKRAGWHIRQDAQAHAVHHRGGSGPVQKLVHNRKRLPAYYYSSRTRFFYQAYGYVGFWAANLGWYIGRGLAIFRYLIGRPTEPMNAYEFYDIWINTLNPLGPSRAPEEVHEST